MAFDNILFFHYSCAFGNGDPANKRVSFIGVLPMFGEGQFFDAFEHNEADMLEKFAELVAANKRNVWVGWRCSRLDYGLGQIAARYSHLACGTLDMPEHIRDLKELLKIKYGEEFAPVPRIENAAKQNGLTMTGLLTADETKAAHEASNWPALRANIDTRCAIFRSLFRLYASGQFVSAEKAAK